MAASKARTKCRSQHATLFFIKMVLKQKVTARLGFVGQPGRKAIRTPGLTLYDASRHSVVDRAAASAVVKASIVPNSCSCRDTAHGCLDAQDIVGAECLHTWGHQGPRPRAVQAQEAPDVSRHKPSAFGQDFGRHRFDPGLKKR